MRQQPYAPEVNWSAEPEALARGDALFHQHCARCHGAQAVSAVGAIPDLRYASAEVHEELEAIVLGGLRVERGMPSFGHRLSVDEADDIRTYLVSTSLTAAVEEEHAD